MGEPSGIGPDLILSIWQQHAHLNLPPFVVIGCTRTLTQRADLLGLTIPLVSHQPKTRIYSPGQLPDRDITSTPDALTVIDLPVVDPDCCGTLNAANGSAVIEFIDYGVAGVMNKEFAGLVTCPIHKKNLYEAGFRHPGHTEYLAKLATRHTGQPCTPVMMIASDLLRTVPVTIHIPICDVPDHLTAESIKTTIRICNAEMKQRFGIVQPQIAVAGLNPHAGENGSMGLDEQVTITPALEELRHEGLDIQGPLPADTMFHPRARAMYDVAVCMYHDQALIPAKTLAFDEGVNVTLGLPFVRTSPDHGTALDIAGQNIARPDSLICAIRMAATMTTKAGI
jgi:4-hydroxythreonine-4-phosphate dehydrogenase